MAKSFFKKIIVAINGRQSSIHAAMYAVMMARSYNLSLKFVYVVDTATIKYLTMNKLLISDEKMTFEERLYADGEHYLSYVKMLAGTKGVTAETELRSGGVFTEIIKAANEYEADLILLGGNLREVGKPGIKKNVFSHDENEVLVNAKCPVLVVQKPDIEKLFKVF